MESTDPYPALTDIDDDDDHDKDPDFEIKDSESESSEGEICSSVANSEVIPIVHHSSACPSTQPSLDLESASVDSSRIKSSCPAAGGCAETTGLRVSVATKSDERTRVWD